MTIEYDCDECNDSGWANPETGTCYCRTYHGQRELRLKMDIKMLKRRVRQLECP